MAAEGGFEMEEVDYKTRYSNLDNDALNDEYDTLEDRLSKSPLDDRAKEEMTYINTLWDKADSQGVVRRRRLRGESSTNIAETSFSGEERTVTKADLEHNQVMLDVARFIKEKFSVDINWGVDEGDDLSRKIGLSKNGDVKYSRMGGKRKIVEPQIVLKKENGVWDYNKSKSGPIVKAVKAFKESIGIAADQSKKMKATVKSMPMVDGGFRLPPGVFDRLSAEQKKEVNGVFIELSSELVKRGREEYLRIEIDKYLVRRIRAVSAATNEPNEDEAIKLHQKVSDYDAVVEVIESRIELEKTYGEQVEDIMRLQRVKKWLKENMVGLSAIGITVASLITTIIIGERTVITKGAQATQSFAKAVRDAIAKLGPWATGLANLVYTIIKASASAISFLARNLWIIVIAVSYFLWDPAQATKG